MIELDVPLLDGGVIHAYDTGWRSSDQLAVAWHHGTPNIGLPPAPLFAASERLGIRWFSHDRPGYGGSTRRLGRNVSSVAPDTAAVADALGIDRFGAVGHSSGGPHALACAALLPERVRGVVAISGPAPLGSAGLDWFGGMADSVAGSLRAAAAGREAKERHEETATDDASMFIAADHAALGGEWSWFMSVVNAALANGNAGLVDDDLATVSPWGFDPAVIAAPTLLLHGGSDRLIPFAHSEWLASRVPSAELWARPDEGHISVLSSAPDALEWLRRATGSGFASDTASP